MRLGDKGKLGFTLVLVTFMILSSFIFYSADSTSVTDNKYKVVWLSVDSANYYRLYNLTIEGLLPTFRFIFENSAHGPMTVVYPSATAVNHASKATGAPPGATGIVANSIHLPGTTVTSTVSGFNGAYLIAEPIWVTADRSGLRTVVVSFPQSTPPAWSGKVSVDRTKLFNIYDAFISPVSFSTLYTNNRNIPRATYITISDALNWKNTDRLGYVYNAWESSFRLGDSTWYLYLADLNGDNKPDKLVIVPEDKDIAKALAVLGEGEWSKPLNTTIVFRGTTYIVAPMFKLIKLDVDDFRLYRGIMRPYNTAWFNDERLAWEVWNNVIVRVGTFTDGDWFALTNGWIDVETYMETVYYTNLFFKEFTLYVLRNTKWDLLMTYTPVIDNVYHQFLGMLYSNMPYYKHDEASYYRSLIARTYMYVDEFVKGILESIDPRNTVLVITSDHGQCPVKYIVNINAILYNANLISIRGGAVALNETKAWYVSHGHIFVNLAGREDRGIVRPEEYLDVVNQVIKALQEVRDPDTNEPVFDIILTRDQAVTLNLWGPRVGDVVIATRCGYTATGGIPTIRDGRAIVFTPAAPLRTLIADHGTILPTYRDLHGTFIAYGGPVKRGYIGVVSILNIAPTISEILGIDRPRDSTSAPLPIRIETLVVPTTITATETRIIESTATVTRTIPTTITTTLQTTTTLTRTIESTVTSIATVLATITQTSTVEKLRLDTLAVVAIIALLVGASIGFIMRKR
ncbi:MAG: alkaline phosphatase family protein [Acidilobaceae archaeon]